MEVIVREAKHSMSEEKPATSSAPEKESGRRTTPHQAAHAAAETAGISSSPASLTSTGGSRGRAGGSSSFDFAEKSYYGRLANATIAAGRIDTDWFPHQFYRHQFATLRPGLFVSRYSFQWFLRKREVGAAPHPPPASGETTARGGPPRRRLATRTSSRTGVEGAEDFSTIRRTPSVPGGSSIDDPGTEVVPSMENSGASSSYNSGKTRPKSLDGRQSVGVRATKKSKTQEKLVKRTTVDVAAGPSERSEEDPAKKVDSVQQGQLGLDKTSSPDTFDTFSAGRGNHIGVVPFRPWLRDLWHEGAAPMYNNGFDAEAEEVLSQKGCFLSVTGPVAVHKWRDRCCAAYEGSKDDDESCWDLIFTRDTCCQPQIPELDWTENWPGARVVLKRDGIR